MSEKRFKENEENRLSISTPTNGDSTLVYCPKCRSKAVITLHNDEARLSCSVVKSILLILINKIFY